MINNRPISDINHNLGVASNMNSESDVNGVDKLSALKFRISDIYRIADIEKKLELMSDKLGKMIKSIDDKMAEFGKQ